MTPTERDTLLLEIDKKLSTHMAVQQEMCKGCRDTVAGHDLDLNGRHGNSESPGLKADMVAVKQSMASMKRSQGRYVLWLQAQLGAVILGLLAMLKTLVGK